ncbi:MAG TPA: thioredoxin [Acidimicrobiales bacterium]
MTPQLPDGLVAVVKRECETCVMVVPVLAALQASPGLTLYVQDDPDFPAELHKALDDDLAISWHHAIETVPTLLRIEAGHVIDRTEGWLRSEWERVSGVGGLGPELPAFRPGCGSLSVDPDRVDELRARFEGGRLRSRRIELADREDEFEALFDRGVTDGLPVVPPTEERVLAMLDGTTRSPDDVVAVAPPDLVELTVEKVAVNAVMAGCKPEYLPVVLTALEAVCTDEFNMHGVLATTMPVGPVIVVNGPITRAIGMNSGGNVLGQGNRANLTIGRAVQLTIRNVGGGRPGGVDRAAHGNPGKLSFCFAEDEAGSPFTPLHVSRGFGPDQSTVTVFAGEGPRCVVDQLARDPEHLATSLAACLRTVHHPKLVLAFDAILVIGPEHARVFAEAGWDRDRVVAALHERLLLPMEEIGRGAGGMAEGVPLSITAPALPKFRPDGVLLVHAGGGAGLFSAIIAGWANGAMGSQPVTRSIST